MYSQPNGPDQLAYYMYTYYYIRLDIVETFYYSFIYFHLQYGIILCNKAAPFI